jgi:hypothetical protein
MGLGPHISAQVGVRQQRDEECSTLHRAMTWVVVNQDITSVFQPFHR